MQLCKQNSANKYYPRKYILIIYKYISNNDINIIKKMSSINYKEQQDKLDEENKLEDRLKHMASLFLK